MWKGFFTDIFMPQVFTCFKEKKSWKAAAGDLASGISMGAFCFPLAIAFAIASGVDPIKGLVTALIGGFLTALFSGSRVQIGGPSGTLAVVSLLIVQKHGFDGLLITTLLAGTLLIFFGITRLGSLIKYIPDTVTMAYSTGIAIMIFSSQIIDLFGLEVPYVPSHIGQKWWVIAQSIATFNWVSFLIGSTSLGILIFFRIRFPKFPAAILALGFGGMLCNLFHCNIDTIGSRFGTLEGSIPSFSFPLLSLEKAQGVFHDSVMMAVLIAVESIMAAVVTSSKIACRARYDCELVCQGLVNITSSLFAGLPCCGSLSRGNTNIAYGAKTPLSGMIQAIFIGFLLYFCGGIIPFIPMASVAAVLLMLGWNMLELKQCIKFFSAPRADVIVFLIVFLLIIFVDVTAGVEIGVVLSTSLFIKRMSENENAIKFTEVFSDNAQTNDPDYLDKKRVPDGVEVCEINGPFFYGIVERFKELMNREGPSPKVFILRMRKVPFIDATAMRAIFELHSKCKSQDTLLLLSGVTGNIREELKKMGIEKKVGSEAIFPNIESALSLACSLLFKEEQTSALLEVQDESAAEEEDQNPQEILDPI